MKKQQHYVITLGRKYGSGGGEVAKKLSEKLGIPYYDKEILQMVADESGIKESYFHVADERAGDKILYKVIKSMSPKISSPSVDGNILSDDNLFMFQSQVIQKLAEQESCIIIGRCADVVLKDHPRLCRIFINADKIPRLLRLKERLGVDTNKEIEKLMKKTDKQRSDYYNYYTGKKWADMDNYDMILDSGVLGIDTCVDVIAAYVEIRGFKEAGK
ncbi:MAG: cytidylate kinase-like family protein [Lachnospiraceae bacterium]|nr:cytidylate kinase-like family protein [Lachnospiraceae bacterium]